MHQLSRCRFMRLKRPGTGSARVYRIAALCFVVMILPGVPLVFARRQSPKPEPTAQTLRAETLINHAKHADVSAMDPRLSRQEFADWLAKTTGPAATIPWETNDGGEATAGPADKQRDLPICVEAEARFPDGRVVALTLSVATRQKGLTQKPTGFYDMYIRQGE